MYDLMGPVMKDALNQLNLYSILFSWPMGSKGIVLLPLPKEYG